jgi:GntR family transcriptional regulator
MSDNDDGRPLSAQVREHLVERIRTGAWKPGQLIPNEFEIAGEFRVSQGTARKAISELAAEGLVVRRQGRGTFVVERTPANVQFRFFNIFDDAGAAVLPDSRDVESGVAEASDPERAALGLEEEAQVIRISRTRTRDGVPFIRETIVLPQALFPELLDRPEVTNTLYDLFQKEYGILVMRTDDRLSAIVADTDTAAALAMPPGAPLLRIDRVAFALDDTPVEWRVSLCHLDGAHYLARTK